jgi:DNA-binding CsgD family transcriptional regulator
MMTDLSLTPLACDAGAAAILAAPNTAARQEFPVRLPPEVLEAFRGRKPAEMGAVKSSFVRGKSRYKCRAFVIEPWTTAMPGPLVAFTFQRDPCMEDAVAHVASQYGLTEREREVLKGVAGGLTSKELATRMDISPNTVKAFLRLIMGKMGVATRAGLVGKLLE